MVDRNVAKKLCSSDLKEHHGPVHYILHHEVLKPESQSTMEHVFTPNGKRIQENIVALS